MRQTTIQDFLDTIPEDLKETLSSPEGLPDDDIENESDLDELFSELLYDQVTRYLGANRFITETEAHTLLTLKSLLSKEG